MIWKCVSLTSRNYFVGFKGLALEILCVLSPKFDFFTCNSVNSILEKSKN